MMHFYATPNGKIR